MQNLKAQKMKTEKMGGAAYNTGMGRGETGEGIDNTAYDSLKKDNTNTTPSYMGHVRNRNKSNSLWQQRRYRDESPYMDKYNKSELWND